MLCCVTRCLATLALVAACTYEVARHPTLGGGHLGPDGAVVEVRDEVDIEHLCGPMHYFGYFITFGLLYIVDSIVEAKTGERECPRTDTKYEHAGTIKLPIATSDPQRKVVPFIPACALAGPDEGCATDRSPRDVPPGLPPTLHVVAVSADRRRVVGRLPSYACAIVTVADLHETPIAGACEDVRFADNHTIILEGRPPLAVMLDADTGVELGRGDHMTWLGGGLASVWRKNEIDIVERAGFQPIATIDLKGAILDAGSLVAIGSASIVTIRLDAKPVRVATEVEIAGVLDARGDLALVQLRTERHTPPKAAVIRVSTGKVVAR